VQNDLGEDMRRNRIRKLVTVGAVLLAGLVAIPLTATPAAACRCAMSTTLESAESSSAVFTGTMIGQASIGERGPWSMPDVAVTFEVHAVYKGDLGPTQVIVTSPNSASCGYQFFDGQEYAVFAYLAADDETANVPVGTLSTGLCSKTAPVADVIDLDTLGNPHPPRDEEEPGDLGSSEEEVAAANSTGESTDDGRATQDIAVGAAVLTLLAAGAGFVLLRRGRA